MRLKIVQQFPDFEERIDFLFQNDENFRDLCSDYDLCTSMILQRKIAEHKNKAEINEYETLQLILKEDIIKVLQSQT
ncbi:hypothetical protein GCM10010976_18430 [Bizionia arctica]|uniref:Uncharacterized protein n=1 Tax=Bizionia arctica TaxID=1495645 RepID=A0A917GIR3_9FLAO|nr:hypothetical protein GCM10010976_18430 [Bizionia arctica]